MKLTAIKTIYLSKKVVNPGEDFEASTELAHRLIERGKAGKQGTVEVPVEGAPPVVEADSAKDTAKPAAKK